jgi:hypothetical protein
MDNHGIHNTPDNVSQMAELEIQPIWLPACKPLSTTFGFDCV